MALVRINSFVSLFATICFVWTFPFLAEVIVKCASFLVVLWLSGLFANILRKFFFNNRVSSFNKAVFITGCDSGFGHQLALRLDSLGFHVFAGCLSTSSDGAKSLQMTGSQRFQILELDVTKDESVEKALDFVSSKLGDKDLWAVVNNAGISQAGEVDWSSLDQFQRVYDVNTMGVVRVTKAFLDLLKKSRGRVVNLTSACGRITCPGFVGYCMSKSAATSFTTGLRMEISKWGVRAISIEPWFYRTPITSIDRTLEILDSTWNKAPQNVKEQYGTQYLDAFRQCCRSILGSSSPNVHEVIDCLEDAILAEEPLSSYFPCDIINRFMLFILSLFPPVVIETVQRLHMPVFIKPSALTQDSQDKAKVL